MEGLAIIFAFGAIACAVKDKLVLALIFVICAYDCVR